MHAKRDGNLSHPSVSGRRLLSTCPDITILSSTPEMPDPFLNATLERTRRVELCPNCSSNRTRARTISLSLRTGEAEEPPQYNVPWCSGLERGHVGSSAENVQSRMCIQGRQVCPEACTEGDEEVWLPRRGTAEILPRLLSIGCLPVAKRVETGSAGSQASSRLGFVARPG